MRKIISRVLMVAGFILLLPGAILMIPGLIINIIGEELDNKPEN